MPEATLRVWTIQRLGWWHLLQQRGTLGGDGRRVTWPELRRSYRWLMGEMHHRLPNYTGHYPIWFWHTPKPDLRRRAHLPKNTRGVRLELQLPASRTLLLDFHSWHNILNNSAIPLSDAEAPPQQIESTWPRVFDLQALRRSELWAPADTIQGVTEHIHLSDVRHVQEFTAR